MRKIRKTILSGRYRRQQKLRLGLALSRGMCGHTSDPIVGNKLLGPGTHSGQVRSSR